MPRSALRWLPVALLALGGASAVVFTDHKDACEFPGSRNLPTHCCRPRALCPHTQLSHGQPPRCVRRLLTEETPDRLRQNPVRPLPAPALALLHRFSRRSLTAPVPGRSKAFPNQCWAYWSDTDTLDQCQAQCIKLKCPCLGYKSTDTGYFHKCRWVASLQRCLAAHRSGQAGADKHARYLTLRSPLCLTSQLLLLPGGLLLRRILSNDVYSGKTQKSGTGFVAYTTVRPPGRLLLM